MARSLASPPKPFTPAFRVLENTIALHVPGLPPSPNATTGRHWSSGYKDKQFWQNEVAKAAVVAKVQQRHKIKEAPFKKAFIHFAICFSDRRVHDPDNINWAVTKPALDGIKSILIEDDSVDAVQLSYEYDREYPRGFYIWVTPLD